MLLAWVAKGRQFSRTTTAFGFNVHFQSIAKSRYLHGNVYFGALLTLASTLSDPRFDCGCGIGEQYQQAGCVECDKPMLALEADQKIACEQNYKLIRLG